MTVCPDIIEYTDAEQTRLLDEAETLPEDSFLLTALNDYGDLRAKIRVCKSANQ